VGKKKTRNSAARGEALKKTKKKGRNANKTWTQAGKITKSFERGGEVKKTSISTGKISENFKTRKERGRVANGNGSGRWGEGKLATSLTSGWSTQGRKIGQG